MTALGFRARGRRIHVYGHVAQIAGGKFTSATALIDWLEQKNKLFPFLRGKRDLPPSETQNLRSCLGPGCYELREVGLESDWRLKDPYDSQTSRSGVWVSRHQPGQPIVTSQLHSSYSSWGSFTKYPYEALHHSPPKAETPRPEPLNPKP